MLKCKLKECGCLISNKLACEVFKKSFCLSRQLRVRCSYYMVAQNMLRTCEGKQIILKRTKKALLLQIQKTVLKGTNYLFHYKIAHRIMSYHLLQLSWLRARNFLLCQVTDKKEEKKYGVKNFRKSIILRKNFDIMKEKKLVSLMNAVPE